MVHVCCFIYCLHVQAISPWKALSGVHFSELSAYVAPGLYTVCCSQRSDSCDCTWLCMSSSVFLRHTSSTVSSMERMIVSYPLIYVVESCLFTLETNSTFKFFIAGADVHLLNEIHIILVQSFLPHVQALILFQCSSLQLNSLCMTSSIGFGKLSIHSWGNNYFALIGAFQRGL